MAKKALRVVLYALVLLTLLLAALALWLRFEFAAVQSSESSAAPVQKIQLAASIQSDEPEIECDQQHPEKKAWFGALHVHTSASYDATAFGVSTTADDAYSFGSGHSISLKLRSDPPGYVPPRLTISAPLDFMAVTDHAESIGENALCYDSESEAYDRLVCRLFRGDVRLPVDELLQPMVRLVTLAIFGSDRSRRICGADGSLCQQQDQLAWQRNRSTTEKWLDRSKNCSFTTLHAYEYTLAEEASNLHRNVIFKSAVVPKRVLSSKEAKKPEDLWRWLKKDCINGSPDCDVIAIPHNSNWSSGRMWFPESGTDTLRPMAKELAQLRAELEPLAEILQVKGDSECRNGIASVIGGNDEFCDFEKLRPASEAIEDCGETMGSGGMMLRGCVSRYSFVRYALTAGLAQYEKLGINPFRFGIVAATDTHNGTPAAGMERNSPGSHGADRDVQHRLKGKVEVPGDIATGSPVRYNSGGIAGVYARQNSRTALFEAMRNRETFGTSGPRIEPRFFASWNFATDICQQPQWLQLAYDSGTPMGGEIQASGNPDQAPVFLVSATADPKSGATPLQRIQIIKGWIDEQGRTNQAIYDVAGDPNNGARVDTQTCERSGKGYRQLCATWSDPEFDPASSAVYYARTLENPSCRWSQYDCLSLPEEERPPSCSDPALPKVIQERAWTSPIWYQP